MQNVVTQPRAHNYAHSLSGIVTGLMLVLLGTWCNAATAAQGFQKVVVDVAGISMSVPSEWKYDKKETTFEAGSFTIAIRSNRNPDNKSLDAFVKQNEAFNKKLAQTIKENQYYKLMSQSKFSSKSGVNGIRSVYGIKKEKPSAITYYLFNKKKRVITVDLQFKIWDTDAMWKAIDTIISSGLTLT